jgi:acetyl-CoA synthetase
VESALLEHPSVLECAITAAPDPVRGQVVKATIVLARGFEASKEIVKELQDHVKRVTAPYKYPRIIEFVPELPKTVSGKIQRNVIRKMDEEKNPL